MLENFTHVMARWESWWKRENTDPIVYAHFPAGDISLMEPYRKDWMSEQVVSQWQYCAQEQLLGQAIELYLQTGQDHYVEDIIEYLRHYHRLLGHAGEGYHFLHPGFGPSALAGIISGYAHFTGSTIWFEPEEALDYDTIDRLLNEKSPYAEAVERWMPELVKACQEHYVISTPDFGSGMDVLAALRHTMNLLTDTYDEQDRVHQALDGISACSKHYHQWAREIIAPGNHGAHSVVMRYLSAEPNYLSYCDFSAMISPDMFQEFVLPTLKDHCARHPGRTVFHLDGPGEIPHVDLICSDENLFGIQWVQGAGNPGSIDPAWDDLYRQILDHGKRICLCNAPADADALTAFFKRFPKQEFVVPMSAPDRKTAEDILLAIQG